MTIQVNDEDMMFHITLKSANEKTGPIPVSTSSFATCPNNCALKSNGCYAQGGPLGMHWKKVTEGTRGISFDAFCDIVSKLPIGQLWRHNQAGDLPGYEDSINEPMLRKLVAANKGKRGYTYSHKELTESNARAIKDANDNGFTINISCDTMVQADVAKQTNVGPVVVIVPENHPEHSVTPNGHKVLVCPVQTEKTESCATCKLCAWTDREVIIAFRAHGASKRKAELVSIGGLK